MTDELTKVCSKCGRELPLSEFNKNKTRKDGLQTHCRDCRKEYYRTHSEETLKYHKVYRENHCDEISKNSKEYYDTHREEILKKQKVYYENNQSDVLKYNKKYYKCVTNPSCPRVGKNGAKFEIFKCEICGKEFRRLKLNVDWNYEHLGNLPRFCSRECYYESMRKSHKSKYEKEIERIKKET